MSRVAVLVVLWALVGVPLLVRYLQERRALPMEEFQRAMGALQPPRARGFGLGRRTAGRRRLVSTLTYAPGALLLLVGLPIRDTPVLAIGLVLVNLGTAHRLVALVVDRGHTRSMAAHPVMFELAPTGLAFDPVVDEGAGDAHAWGDGWQIIGPEPRGVHDLVLVDADVS